MSGHNDIPPVPPDLSGLLDDSFASMLEDMLAVDPQMNNLELPDCLGPAHLQDYGPAQGFAPGFPQQQVPLISPGPDHYEDHSFEKKRSGSGKGCLSLSVQSDSAKLRSCMLLLLPCTVTPGPFEADDSHSGAFNEGTSIDITTKRQKAHQDKNKRAQKRYREKKKAQAEEQKCQIEALTAQLEHLMASKVQLESRCHLLEKVVKMREAPIDANPQA